jgi:hypothetical protein
VEIIDSNGQVIAGYRCEYRRFAGLSGREQKKIAMRSIGGSSLEKQPAKSITCSEENQDHQHHDQSHSPDHR